MLSVPPLKEVRPLSWIKCKIVVPSGKIGIYVRNVNNTIPPALDIDFHMGIGVAAIQPELLLKDLVCLNDIICAVNGVDTHSFTERKILK